MRIEQLVLYGPGDDDRVRFSPGFTVFAGLAAQERTDLIETVVDALTGQLSNASVAYTDQNGRKVFADRTGATYADTGEAAPAPQDLLGHDPDVVVKLLSLTADDLGLGDQISAAELQAQLTTARGELERRSDELRELRGRAETVEEWRTEIAELRARIDHHDDDVARWAWIQLRGELDELRAELNVHDHVGQGHTDQQILQAVDAIRTIGETWADLAAEAASLQAGLGSLPAVSEEDLARVAATPADLPADFTSRLDAWRAAVDLRRTADAELSQATAPPPTPDDPLVVAFAEVDQVKLWERHTTLELATETYAQVANDSDRNDLAPETEDAIEAAHIQVVQCQKEVERRFTLGALGTGLLAALALLVGNVISIPIGAVLLAASVGVAVWLLVVPRRRLAAAAIVEEQALANADAGSWLGLHLRRLSPANDPLERKRFETAAKNRAAAQVEWDEIAGAVSPEDLSARADAVRAYADAIAPKSIARRIEQARSFSAAAATAETAARRAITTGLEAYGFTESSTEDLDPTQLEPLLKRRIEAGHVARRARKLSVIEKREADAARRLDELLRHLGYDDGDVESRLERAIQAVAVARKRQTDVTRTQADIRLDIERAIDELRATARPSWAHSPDPTNPPVDVKMLDARLREIDELVSSAGNPDVVGAQHRFDVCQAEVRKIEQRLDGMANGPGSLQHQLVGRLGRTTWLGDREENVPVFIDDALRSVPDAEKLDLLDLLNRISAEVQIVLLSDDPAVDRWARDRAQHTDVVLYEAEEPVEPLVVGPPRLPASVTIF